MNRSNILIIAGVALAGALITTSVTYTRDLSGARSRVASGSQLARTSCGPIEYAVAGKGPALLMIHGAGGGFDQGLDFARPLIDAGFQVISVSRFGYLRTPLPADASPMAQADAHACLLDSLQVRSAAVIGGSAGAPSALQLCLRHPERCSALILAVPILFAPGAQAAPPPTAIAKFLRNTALRSDFVFWLVSKLGSGALTKHILATPPADVSNASPDEQERVASVMRNILPISPRADGLRNDMAIGGSIQRYELENCDVPTLLVSVENDLFGTYANARYTAQHIPGARLLGFATGGHLWAGHQQEVWREIISFLSYSQRNAVTGSERVARRAGK